MQGEPIIIEHMGERVEVVIQRVRTKKQVVVRLDGPRSFNIVREKVNEKNAAAEIPVVG